jgi:predicted kinase
MLILVRGLPGAGKSTFARAFKSALTFAADDYFYKRGEGKYAFDPLLLGEAHAECQRHTRASLEAGEVVVVTNTFSCRWELEPYLKMASELGLRVVVADLFDAGLDDAALVARGLHGVPQEVIAAMRQRWEHNWREADPRAPWERPKEG